MNLSKWLGPGNRYEFLFCSRLSRLTPLKRARFKRLRLGLRPMVTVGVKSTASNLGDLRIIIGLLL
jgi:hypothetical protein